MDNKNRNQIIENKIKSEISNIAYDKIQIDFFTKKGDKDNVNRYKERIKEHQENIDIWESLLIKED